MVEPVIDGRYTILAKLGEGGMGAVYRARDERLDREVAIKRLRVFGASPEMMEQFLQRFEREARSMARFSHPNIIRLLDYGKDDQGVYLVLEYMPNGTLKDRIGEPMPPARAARLLKPIADALSFVHARGLIHRDIKPANILFDEIDNPMLADFGIVKLVGQEGMTLTITGAGIGTPYYMAPEQMRKDFDHHVDQYALGIIFYELLTGKKPFEGDTPMQTLFMQATAPLPDPRLIVPDLPEDCCALLQTALAKQPEDRYPGMAEFSQALEGIIQSGSQPINVPRPLHAASLRGTSQPIVPPGPLQSAVIPAAKKIQPQEDPTVLQNSAHFANAQPMPVPVPAAVPAAQPVSAEAPAPVNRRTRARPAHMRTLPVRKLLSLAGGMVLLAGLIIGGIWLIRNLPGAGNTPQTGNSLALKLTQQAANAPESDPTDDAQPAQQAQSTRERPLPTATAQQAETPAEPVLPFSGRSFPDVSLEPVALGQNLVFPTGFEQVYDIAISPAGSLLAVNRHDGIYLFDLLEQKNRYRIDLPLYDHISPLAFSPDGNRLATVISSIQGSTLIVWDTGSGEELWTMELKRYCNDISFSPDGMQIAIAHTTGLTVVAAGEPHDVVFTLTPAVFSLRFSPDGDEIALAFRNSVQVYRTRPWEYSRHITEEEYTIFKAVDWSSDGELIVNGSNIPAVKINRRSDSALVFQYDDPDYSGTYHPQAAFSPDSSKLAYTLADAVQIALPEGGGWVFSRAIPVEDVSGNALAWGPDSHQLAVATQYGVLLIFID